MKVRFEIVVDLGDGSGDDDEFHREMVEAADKVTAQLEKIGELQEFGNGLPWEPVD